MDCVKCDDLYALYRGVYVSSKWRESCFNLVSDELSKRPVRVDFPRRVCERLFAVYFLEIFNFESQFSSIFVDLVDNVTAATHLPRKDVRYILETGAPGKVSELFVPVETPQPYVTDGKLYLGDLELGTFGGSSEEMAPATKKLLRYYLIKDAFNLDYSLVPSGYVLINSLGVPGNYSLFREDEGTKGILPRSPPSSSKYCGIVPPSHKYLKWVLAQLKKNKYLLLTTLDVTGKLPRETSVRKVAGITIVSSGVSVDEIQRDITENVPPFPYTASFMPPFDEMFGRLVDVAELLPLEWSMPVGDCDLGIVVLSYELSYRQTASIADHYAEPARVKCRRGPYKELGVLVSPISPIDQWKVMMLSAERNYILSLPVNEQRELVYKEERGCNLFNASYATYIMSRFGGPGSRVLDFSSGWGDRLISGYAAGVREYVHYDPNPELAKVYEEQHEACQKASGRKMLRTYYPVPFEDDSQSYVEGGKHYGRFDLVLTSPPYYEKEIYQGEQTSTTRYKTEDEWFTGFYIPSVTAAWNSLSRGGWMALYLPWHPDKANGLNRMFKEAGRVATSSGAQKKFVKGQEREGIDMYMFCLGYVMTQDGKGVTRKTFMWRKR